MSYDTHFTTMRVMGTKIGNVGRAVLANLMGYKTGDTEAEAERATDIVWGGVVGVVSRPRASSVDGAAVAQVARTDDSVKVLSAVDRRITKALYQAMGELAVGSVALAGYLGQRLVIEDGATNMGKITLAHGNLSVVLDAGPPPKITILNGPLPGPGIASISLDITGTVAITGTAITFNGIPLQIP